MPQAEAAYVQDYDSDQSEAKAGTRVNAQQRASHGRSSKATVQQRGPPYAASDSGYSSYTNNTVASNALAQPLSQRTQMASSARKPTIHQGQGQAVQARAPSRSVSVSRPRPSECNDPNCGDTNCLSQRNSDRRYTLPGHQSQQQQQPRPQTQQQRSRTTQHHYPVQNPPTPMTYQQSPTYTYAQPTAAQPVPTLNPQPTPRPRAPSTSHSARPVSWFGGMYGSTPPQSTYPMTGQGLPPSPSVGYGQMPYYTSTAAPQLGSTPPANAMAPYMQAPMVGMIPPSPQRPTNMYSARQTTLPAIGNPMAPLQQSLPQIVPTPAFSARKTSFNMPGSFPRDSPLRDSESESESDSRSDSDSDYSDHARRQRYERDRYEQQERDRRRMPPPTMAHRPSLKKTKTAPLPSEKTSREPMRRHGRSDSDLDRADSDRTTRPVIDRTRSYTSNESSRSRRPSVSTTSSGRTKNTADSSISGSATGRYIVEDTRGRRSIYASREEAERMAQLFAGTTLDEAKAYQNRMSGGAQAPEITLDEIKRSQQTRKTHSHVSGSSRKSGTSSKASKPESGIHIRTGDTVLQIQGGAKIEVRQGEDGEQMLIIGSTSGRESGYNGSTGSGSRVGRSRAGSRMRRRDTIHEEDGYEAGL